MGELEWLSETCGGTKTRNYLVNTPAAHGGEECPFGNGEEQPNNCNEGPCPIDCVGSWGDYGSCNASCGGGTKTRTYSVTTPAQHGGAECPANHGDTDETNCNEDPCPVDCVGSWGDYGSCNTTCGPGTKTREYTVTTPAQHGGAECPSNHGEKDYDSCNEGPCPIDCVGSWGDYGSCTASCGGGTKTREYTITTPAQHGGAECPANHGDTEEINCNEDPRPVDCVGSWGSWGS